MKKVIIFFMVLPLFLGQLYAKEGMWLPTLLGKYNLAEMQQMGFQLSAQDIYDVNHASMKDAVVIFGGGCTGELISNEGLLITNHHCGYSRIQAHSSLEHDYLTNGFWAMDKSQELPNPGLTVSFLEYMKDVTAEVLAGTDGLSEEETSKKIEKNTAELEKAASEDGKFKTQIKPLFYGNQYFLYVYKVYPDVRLVGAPPSAIGKFGGDTDNWMWPRHTGDFSLFRIYAGKDNEPADYSPDNVPYQPKKYFPISMKGIQPGDFTMVFGNPGRTYEYIPSKEVDIIMTQRDPDRIKIRDKKLEIIGADMEKDAGVRIQYSAKYQSISNAWKKWQGEVKGLERLGAVGQKQAFEKEFQTWAETNGKWKNNFRPVFSNFEQIYDRYAGCIGASDYYTEIVLGGVEIFSLATQLSVIISLIENKQTDNLKESCNGMLKRLPGFYKNFNQPTDEKLFAALIPMLATNVDPRFLPAGFAEQVKNQTTDDFLKTVYRKSVVANRLKMEQLLRGANPKQLLKLRKDPMVAMVKNLGLHYLTAIKPVVDSLTVQLENNMKTYMAGIMEMKSGQALYPDANLTLRVTYGKVEGYSPMDGVSYKYLTTLDGIMEKDNPEIYDYDVPARLKELYKTKDFGRYEVNGTVPVAFVASNHTSGGNSGSPVVNGNGELIGVNFDRCWEGTMSDIMFDPDMCRNISIDIRYALFIIDKFAGAGYLLDEMKLVE